MQKKSIDSATINCVNVNSATPEELDQLSGIGIAMAHRIIQYRQTVGRFEKVQDLLNVRGIGEFTLKKIEKNICF